MTTRPKWIKVSKRLPKQNKDFRSNDVLAINADGDIRVACVEYHDCQLGKDLCSGYVWKLAGHESYDFEAVAWMSLNVLPKAPR